MKKDLHPEYHAIDVKLVKLPEDVKRQGETGAEIVTSYPHNDVLQGKFVVHELKKDGNAVKHEDCNASPCVLLREADYN